MMKSLKFIFDFYRSNKLASILLFLVFTVAVFFSSFALGRSSISHLCQRHFYEDWTQ